MTVTSRVPALIDYLVTLFTNDPTIDGRAEGPCWVSHRCCRMIRAAVLNAAGTLVPHPAT